MIVFFFFFTELFNGEAKKKIVESTGYNTIKKITFKKCINSTSRMMWKSCWKF